VDYTITSKNLGNFIKCISRVGSDAESGPPMPSVLYPWEPCKVPGIFHKLQIPRKIPQFFLKGITTSWRIQHHLLGLPPSQAWPHIRKSLRMSTSPIKKTLKFQKGFRYALSQKK